MSLDAIRARLARDGAYYIDASILEELEKGKACDYGQRTAAKMLRLRGDWVVFAEEEIKRITEERDAARAEVCLLRPSVALGAQTAKEYAVSRGWDNLFNEEDNAR